MKHLERSGNQKKKTRFSGLFFLTGLRPVLPLGQWLPSKPWPERSTFLDSTCKHVCPQPSQNFWTKVLIRTQNVLTNVPQHSTLIILYYSCSLSKSLAVHHKCLNKSIVSHPTCLNKRLTSHPTHPNFWAKVLLCTESFEQKSCFAPKMSEEKSSFAPKMLLIAHCLPREAWPDCVYWCCLLVIT